MKRPKHYRQQIYEYVEDLLGRSLTFDEHDDIRDMIGEYVFSTQNAHAILQRLLCKHDWNVDKKVEIGEKYRLFVKCSKCDKRTTKKMSMHSARL